MALRPCKGCGKPWPSSWCDECGNPNDRRRAERSIEYGYTSPEWNAIRVARMAYALGRCELNHPGCTTLATSVHLLPEAPCYPDHRQARLEDVRAACAHCHGIEDAPRANA